MTLNTLLCPIEHRACLKVTLECPEGVLYINQLLVRIQYLCFRQICYVCGYADISVIFLALCYLCFVEYITALAGFL